MDEFDDDDVAVNAPLDVRFVIVGVLMMIVSLILFPVLENPYLKIFFALTFFSSIFVMTKRKKED